MEAATESHAHHELPTSGSALTSVAFSATLHCLTGCAIGEVTGMVIGTALGFSDWGTVALAVALAFLFGYALTSLPLLRAGLALTAVVPIALASDTVSIGIMEIVDNAIMLAIPGAMEAGVDSTLFWGSLSVALVIAGAIALPFNRWLIGRGKGHAAVHETGIHGGPPIRVVAAVAAVAAVFGTVVLVAEAIDPSETEHGGGHGGGGAAAQAPDPVRGLAVSDEGMTLSLARTELQRGQETELRLRILGRDGQPVRDFEVEHEKKMHLIIARRDLTGFQHLHPELGGDGAWTTRVTIPEAGNYRVFADFKTGGRNETLAADLAVDGSVDWKALPGASDTARTDDGYEVRMDGASAAGRESELRFSVLRHGKRVAVEPYLGAGGHLVALREGDLAYLHVHPSGHGAEAGDGGTDAVAFSTEFPTDGRYRLFLQFKHEGKVHTAAFTKTVGASPGAENRSDSGDGSEGHGHG
jgi:hypothetical protein